MDPCLVIAVHQLHAAGIKNATLDGFNTAAITQTGVPLHRNELDNAQMEMIEADDFAPGSCAIDSEASSLSTRSEEKPAQPVHQGHIEKGPVVKEKRKNAAGVSLLSQLFAAEASQNRKQQARIQPPPGFEHLGARDVVSNAPHGNGSSAAQTTRVQPPPGYEHLGPRDVAAITPAGNVASGRAEEPPLELLKFCPEGHPSR